MHLHNQMSGWLRHWYVVRKTENDFHCACLRTEILLRKLTPSSTLNPNPKSSQVPLRKPAVFSQTAVLSSLISQCH